MTPWLSIIQKSSYTSYCLPLPWRINDDWLATLSLHKSIISIWNEFQRKMKKDIYSKPFVQAPRRLTIFSCSPTWIKTLSSDRKSPNLLRSQFSRKTIQVLTIVKEFWQWRSPNYSLVVKIVLQTFKFLHCNRRYFFAIYVIVPSKTSKKHRQASTIRSLLQNIPWTKPRYSDCFSKPHAPKFPHANLRT